MDGDRKRPIDLGLLTGDVFSDHCLNIIRSMFAAEEEEIGFSLMALVGEPDKDG
jgi:hypothetical protein